MHRRRRRTYPHPAFRKASTPQLGGQRVDDRRRRAVDRGVAVLISDDVAQTGPAFLMVGQPLELALLPPDALGARVFPKEIGVIANREKGPIGKFHSGRYCNLL